METLISILLWPVIILVGTIIVTIIMLRRVVPTNEVHIVQRGNSSVAYGKFSGDDEDKYEGNVYLAWPSWVPKFGVEVQILPLHVFDLQLEGYRAYDKGKVPFVVDITAFYYIHDPIKAAGKIDNLEELRAQLNETLKGVVRKVLASKDIIDIMESRTDIKQEFYKEVLDAVKEWGVTSKNVEFMDIRDPDDGSSEVIGNIMKKKRSEIEAESQIEVAENEKRAKIQKENKESEARAQAAEAESKADIVESDANKEAELKKIENQKATENQEIEKEKTLSIQKEQSKQSIYESEKDTKEKQLAVKQVEEQKKAEIEKETEIIKANEEKEQAVIKAKSEKETTEIQAEADKIEVDKAAQAQADKIKTLGMAKAKEQDYIGTSEAKNKMEMAKALNSFSKDALDYIRKELDAEVAQKVDYEKAKALGNADVKVISTGENGGQGVKDFMGLFSADGGANMGAMVENLKNTVGEDKVNEFISKFKKEDETPSENSNVDNKESEIDDSNLEEDGVEVKETETTNDTENNNTESDNTENSKENS